MSGMKQLGGSGSTRRVRKIKVAPMTRAVRMALAASVVALGLGTGSPAFAAGGKAQLEASLPQMVMAVDPTPVADLTVVSGGMGQAFILPPPEMLAISEYGPGDIVIDNADPILENQTYDAVAIYAYSTGGNVDITNRSTGGLQALSSLGSAIGIYGYAADGSVDISNEGGVFARAVYGLADGIFASGSDVAVSNSGDITAVSVYGGWAAGIEAQATDLTTVQNDGSIYASAAYGQAFGIYATGGDVVVGNSGSIGAQGYYATGIEAQSTGDVSVDNAGDIVAGSISTYYNPYTYGFYVYGSALATGINAGSNGEGASVDVNNSGDISAVSYFGGAGISATSSGQYGTASVTNSGNVYASQYTKYGYGAYGIVTSADGDSSIDNSGGIEVVSAGAASGLTALSFAGDAHVTNSGDIATYSSAALGYASTGITAFAAHGAAHVDNSGSVDATAKYWATAVNATAQGDVSVDNSGSLYADGQKYAFGVYALSSAGDVMVHNDEGGEIGFYSYLGRGWGVFAYASQGDAHVSNDGAISGYAYGQSAGVFAVAGYGDVMVDNTGSIDVVSGGGVAVGAFARADYGTASVDNSGDIAASNFGGYYTGYAAYGILARGAYADVSNSGTIAVAGYYYGTGIAASSYYGTTIDNAGGSISVYAVGGATGIDALSLFGDVAVANASDIQAVGLVFGAQGISTYSVYGDVEIDNSGDIYVASLYGAAIGIYGYALTGDVSINNSGAIAAYSYAGLADGIFASGANVEVSNSGAIETYGYTWSAGIEAQGSESVSVDNSGDIDASAGPFVQVVDYYGYVVGYGAGGTAYGIYATGGEAGASVTNSGNIEVQGGYVTGIEVQSGGDLTVENSGDIVAGSGLNTYYNEGNGYTYYYGTQVATGINATSNGEGAAVSVTSSGDISADGIFGASGIAATSSGNGGTASVDNSGDIYVSQNQKYGYGAYGIVTSADGDSSIDNSGTIYVYSGGVANGVTALSFAGDASVTNSGDIEVYSAAALYYAATGITAFGANGTAHVDNSGSVDASAKYWATAVNATAQGDVSVDNSGSLYADGQKYAFGVYALSNAGDVTVHNEEGGEIGFYSYAGRGWGVFAYAGQGDVHVGNDGAISGYAYGQSAGIFAIAGYGDVTLENSGTIDVVTGGNVAVGMFARADYGTASVNNSGDITASTFGGYYTGYAAYGILARGEYADVANSGDITATGLAFATGIAAASYYGTNVVTTGGDINVSAEGALVQRSFEGYYGTYYYYVLVGAATGIDASAGYGDVTVSNASDITAEAVYVSATGINASALYDVAVTNSGDISASSAYGYATGIDARASTIYLGKYYGSLAFDGTTTVSNSGDITLYAPQQSAGKATGINASRDDGAVVVGNSGDIDIYAGGRSYGIFGFATYGEVSVTNSGDITMLSHTDATIGISASTGNFFFGGGDVSVVNSGDISVHSDYGFANAIGAVAGSVGTPYGDSYIRNSGDLDVFGQYNAAGIQTRASAGNATIINSGDVHVESAALGYVYQPDQTVGIAALTFFGGDLTIQNTGDVTVNGYAMSYGLYAQSFNDGTVRITNAGDVSVHSQYSTDGYVGYFGYDLPPMISRGVFAVDYFGDIIVNNTSTGSIDASGGDIAIGVHTASYSGTVVVNNAGHIHAGDTNFAIGVLMEGVEGTNTLNNAATGVISADGDEGYAFAVMGSYAVDTINNSGRITGAVALYAGDDVFNNRSGGVWDVGGTRSTDFGDGNDSINNFAGGVIHLDDGAIYMGGGTANAFTNLGMIKVSGDTNVIDMGGDGATVNTVALSNVNTISFLDGHSDDALSIVGHLGGTGSLGLDVDLADESSDQLHVEGNMAANAAQRVNIAFAGMPLTASTSIDFAHVSGTSTAGSFVPGQILGYNEARNFLDLDFSIGSRLNTANTAADVFSIELDVVGLNDTGTLAANVASGAAGMLNAQVGTFKQRMGVNPYGDDGKVMSAFFRTYTSEGDVNPAHMAANFGQGGNFAFDQTTWGREVGVNANLHGNVHAGVTLGTADGRQRLTGNGVGSNRMDGMTWGVYATWFAPQGFYVDVSGRWMAVDVVSTSAAGQMQSRAHTGAWNVEAGYNWTVGGLNVVPQLQYTRTEVEDVRAIQGDRATFEGHGGTSTRGRLGVEVSKTFESSGLRWTPYGSINAVREFDGEMTYTVADNFHGSTDIEGTSVMAEAGVGVQKGGWGFTIGANWIDGGAFNSTVGGQALVRFAW
jgi:hypothetical protein